MAELLIVDDSPMDRVRAGGLLQKGTDWTVSYAGNGREALDAMQLRVPDIIISDLQMPEMNGLELVEAVKRDFPAVPVILMTARGSEAIAAEALRKGAASYVPKMRLADNLRETVHRVLAAADEDRMHSRLMHSLEQATHRFRLRNDLELVGPLVAHLQELLRCIPLGDEAERLRVGNAVKHAILIAHFHGNLEIPVDATLNDEAFTALAHSRRGEEPYASRCIIIKWTISTEAAQFMISHEGLRNPSFKISAPLDPDAADRHWLRGFVLVPSVMDDVAVTDSGRTISLLKKAASPESDFEYADELSPAGS